MKNIAEDIFLTTLEEMKNVLNLGEYKLGGDKAVYKYFKKCVMDIFYDNTKKLFVKLEQDGILARCKCESNLRHGYTQCTLCHGAGYVNAPAKDAK